MFDGVVPFVVEPVQVGEVWAGNGSKVPGAGVVAGVQEGGEDVYMWCVVGSLRVVEVGEDHCCRFDGWGGGRDGGEVWHAVGPDDMCGRSG